MTQNYPEVEQYQFSPDELKYREFVLRRLDIALNQRSRNYAEFDDMQYEDWWEASAKAGNAYIRPRNNPEDVSITTGTTTDKIESMLSSLLGLNLEPNVVAYDKENREIYLLGERMEALMRKSRELENPDYDSKKQLYYRESLIFGDAFVEETMYEYAEVAKKKTSGNWDSAINGEVNWEREKKPRIRRELRSNLISGPNFFCGNIKDFYIESQPYIFTREVISYEECVGLYGEWKMWQYVPARIKKVSKDYDLQYHDWQLVNEDAGFVEVIKYYDKPNNGFQIILNGIPMLPVKYTEDSWEEYPLEWLTGQIEYPIAKLSTFPISRHFFYSKGMATKAKIDQAVMDEFLRMFIVKTRRSVKEPMANNTGHHLTDKIFMPGQITEGIDGNRLTPIGNNTGVTPAEFNMYQMLDGLISAKTVSPIFQGQESQGSQTATESVIQQKQSMRNMGSVITGVKIFEEKMAWLRLYMILRYWTEVEDKKLDKMKGELVEKFKRIEVDDTFEDGSEGTRIMEFTAQPKKPEQLKLMEDMASKRGRRIRITQINPKELKNLKPSFEIIITPTPEDADALEKAQFEQSMALGFQLFGQELNRQYWKEQWALKNGLDPEKAFIQQQPQIQGMMGGMPGQPQPQGAGGQQGNVNQQQRRGVQPPRAGNQKSPSVNTLATA